MSDEIKISKKSLWMYSTFVLLAVVIIGGVLLLSGGDGTTAPTGGNDVPGTVSASLDDDALLGNPNAKVTIVEFSDYQCPFCRKFWTDAYAQIKSQYIDTGKVNLVFRDFPLASIHPMAQKSAEAAECVRESGGDEAYFEYHDKMFSEQNILDSGSATGAVTKTITYTTTDLKSWATELGYNIGSCLDSGKYAGEVQKDTTDAQSSGGRGTPYFVIMGEDGKGTALSGAQPFSAFKQVIDSKLA